MTSGANVAAGGVLACAIESASLLTETASGLLIESFEVGKITIPSPLSK